MPQSPVLYCTILTFGVLVYCPFPGFIEHGKILLIGNMGLYEYRPYVRKIQNGRQIMFQVATRATCIHVHSCH